MAASDTGELTLDERVRRLEIQQLLRDLVARYSMAVDDRDLDALADLFTVEGSFRQVSGVAGALGRENVREFYLERMRTMGPSFHYPHSHVIEIMSTTRARGIVTAHAEMGIDGRCVVVALRYNDEYAFEDGAWRFADRALQFLYFMDLEELQTRFSDPLRRRVGEPIPADLPETLPSYQEFVATYGSTQLPSV